MKQMSIGKVAIATMTFACTALLSVGWSEQRGVSLSIESAQARIGRPLTPFSGAGVARRQYRRAAYGYGNSAGLVGAGVAAAAIGTAAATPPWGYYGGGYPGYYGAYAAGNPSYYGGYYANRSYVTGRPTLFPRYYGGYGTGGYYGAYGAGYPGYYGGWANRSYVTGRPTLFPRYYAGNYGAYAYGGYPYGYYPGTPWGGPTLFPRYYGGGW